MQGERFPGSGDGPHPVDLAGALERLLPGAGWGVLYIDPQGVVAAADDLACALVPGSTPLVGSSLIERFPPDERSAVVDCLSGALADRTARTARSAGAGGRLLALHVNPVSWRDGGVGWVALVGEGAGGDRRTASAAEDALRRVAAAVARSEQTEAVFGLVARELVGALAVNSAGVVRVDAGGTATLVGFQAADTTGRQERGSQVPVEPGSVIAEALRRGEPVRRTLDARARLGPRAFEERVAAPVQLPEAVWGALLVAATDPGAMPDDAERRLAAFADLVALALVNAGVRPDAGLRAAAGKERALAGAGAFHERLRVEVERARRHRRALALAVFDVDGFARVNESYGRDVGDAVLAELAERLAELTRSTELVARLGGDELALLLPETSGDGAFAAVERIRRAVTSVPFSPGFLTVSAGVCDLEHARTAEELFRLADEALCRAKAEGRNRVERWVPAAPKAAEAGSAKATRSGALGALHALAAAVDAREPGALGHCERVAELSARLAAVCGWEPGRAALLREAALLHDVGKIGLPDALLGRTGLLTPEEYAKVKEHPERGAEMVASVLTPEQVAWVRGHHERPDGTGYPDGLRGEQIPLGASLLAIAEAWDAMVTSRPPGPARPPSEALAECESQAGRQFAPTAVATLRTLWEAGAFDEGGLVAQPPAG